MTHVSVTIAGRAYRMACDEGQEEHLLGLGRMLDGRIDQLRASFGEIGDMRLAVMAGIMVADELSEAQRRHHALEAELQELRSARASAVARDEQAQLRVAEAVADAAARIEKLAETLHKGVVSGGA
ncbi:cell division protein ZapA [Labrys wisconsinensis]|uniref:Cell division protein ZapA n=1 Tax=Labrys wisconsinensis TaxID=425677 RepID=A0ABU0JEH7_9HYPH|nr:cell division protein ZapA [Labrys wisconsinensis]MDQ0472020.1 cell division protein ZapA [Labrys wisconsinensis]